MKKGLAELGCGFAGGILGMAATVMVITTCTTRVGAPGYGLGLLVLVSGVVLGTALGVAGGYYLWQVMQEEPNAKDDKKPPAGGTGPPS